MAPLIARILLICLPGLILTSAAIADTPRPRALLLTGQGEQSPTRGYPSWHHDFYNEQIVGLLDELVEVTVTEDLSALTRENLAGYDLIINNSLFRTPSAAQFDAFYDFIEQGKSYLALHTGLVTFLNSPRYSQLIGGYFLGWDGRKNLDVHTFDAWYGYDYNDQVQHPIVRSMPNFALKDELFLMHTNTEDMEVIARAEHHPVLWLRHWQKGKVMGLAIGNGREEGANPHYHRLLQNSVRWLVGYPVWEPLPEARFAENTGAVPAVLNLADISHHAADETLSFRIADNSAPGLVGARIDNQQRLHLEFTDNRTGEARINIEAQSPDGLVSTAAFVVSVVPEATGNLAAYHRVTVQTSSNEFRKFTADPRLMVDGNPSTRWSSAYEDPTWILLDLGVEQLVAQVRLQWEGAYGAAYHIEVSEDAQRWRKVFTETNGDGGEDVIQFAPIKARYLRLNGTKRGTIFGYSLYEFEVYGPAAGDRQP